MWCTENYLELNADKCHYIRFTNKHYPTQFSYSLNGLPLTEVMETNDLGVTIDSKLKFDSHIDNITRKAYRMLGFIMRASRDFTTIKPIKILFNSLVRPLLEYNTPIWYPFTDCQIKKVERVQRVFTRQLAYRFNIPYETYNDRLTQINLQSLESRRVYFDMCSLYKVVSEPNSALHSHLNIRHYPYHNRRNTPFVVPISRTDIGKHRCPINRFQSTFIRSFNHIDIFHSSMFQFKRITINHLKHTSIN